MTPSRAPSRPRSTALRRPTQYESITTWSNTDRLARLARGRFDLSGWSVSGIQVKFARGSSHPPLSPAPAPPEPFKKTLSLPRTTFSFFRHHILSGFSVVLHNSFGTTPSFLRLSLVAVYRASHSFTPLSIQLLPSTVSRASSPATSIFSEDRFRESYIFALAQPNFLPSPQVHC